ncbi:pilus assembly protein PilP [Oceanisphaera sp. IT1-181]|uniref:pilus assembly protein PilP n=1 Tax=Oceanisphaera sp. IT1-181 TaxID=3081199 RepID=UPI0029CA1EE8|nr:pilus assembly protein PilP [Oceanisphaera sp. IT1-181]
MVASLMLSACNEPEPMVDYIAQTKAQAKTQEGNGPPSLLPVTAYPALVYQAHAARNPFFWEPLSLAANRPASEISTSLNIATEAELQANEILPACELAPLPDLVLRAVFHEHHKGGAASALIQVADAEIYPVRLGQRLIAKVNNQAAADLGEDLGKVTAITAQSVTLTPSHTINAGCNNTHAITLHLY